MNTDIMETAMSEAPERIWVDDERGIGGVASIHEKEPVYIDLYVTEYVRSDLYETAREEIERLREALRAVQNLKRTGFSKAKAIDMAADIAGTALGKGGSDE